MRTFYIQLFLNEPTGPEKIEVTGQTPKKALERYLNGRNDLKNKFLVEKYSRGTKYSARVTETIRDTNGGVTFGFSKNYSLIYVG